MKKIVVYCYLLPNGYTLESYKHAENTGGYYVLDMATLVHPGGKRLKVSNVAFDKRTSMDFEVTVEVPGATVTTPKIVTADCTDLYRDGGTALYKDSDGKEYYVWRPTGAVYEDSKHAKHLPEIVIKDRETGVLYAWNLEHSVYHREDAQGPGTGFAPGSINDEAARLAAHG